MLSSLLLICGAVHSLVSGSFSTARTKLLQLSNNLHSPAFVTFEQQLTPTSSFRQKSPSCITRWFRYYKYKRKTDLRNVTLLAPVDHLGEPGEVRTVKAAYAWNYLLPARMARISTERDLEYHNKTLNSVVLHPAERQAKLVEVSDRIRRIQLSFTRKDRIKLDGTIGVESVHPQHVADELRRRGFALTKNDVSLDREISKPGHHTAVIKIPGSKPPLSVRIRISVIEKTHREIAEESGTKIMYPTPYDPVYKKGRV